MNAWLLQPGIPVVTFWLLLLETPKLKGWTVHTFADCTEKQNQATLRPFALREVPFLPKLAVGHLLFDWCTDPVKRPPDKVYRADPAPIEAGFGWSWNRGPKVAFRFTE